MINVIIIFIYVFQLQVIAQQNYNRQNSNRFFSFNKYLINTQQDSSALKIMLLKQHSTENIIGQAFAGILCGAGLSAIPFSSASSKLGSREKPNESVLIIAVACYTFGSALGVHWMAKSENPENKYWGSALSSAVGLGIGVGLVFSGIEDPPYVTTVIAALSPLIGSIIYSTAIADWPDENPNMTLQPKILSHKDLVNSSKIVELEILKIRL